MNSKNVAIGAIALLLIAHTARANILNCTQTVGTLVKNCSLTTDRIPGSEAIFEGIAYEADYQVEAVVVNCPLGKPFQSNWQISANGGVTWSKEYIKVGNNEISTLRASGPGPVLIRDERPNLTAFWSIYPTCNLSLSVKVATPSSNTAQLWLSQAASTDRQLQVLTSRYNSKVSVHSWAVMYADDPNGGRETLTIIRDEIKANAEFATADEKVVLNDQVISLDKILANVSYAEIMAPYAEFARDLTALIPTAERDLRRLQFTSQTSQLALESHIAEARSVLAQ